MSDPLLPILNELPQAASDPLRGERTRMRCRARLSRHTRARTSASDFAARAAWAWPSLIAVLGAAYLTGVIVQALRLYRFP
jgi:hypothetical protein